MTFADRPVRELMSSPVVTVPGDALLVEACQLMTGKRLRHLVMVDAAGQAKGVLTQSIWCGIWAMIPWPPCARSPRS